MAKEGRSGDNSDEGLTDGGRGSPVTIPRWVTSARTYTVGMCTSHSTSTQYLRIEASQMIFLSGWLAGGRAGGHWRGLAEWTRGVVWACRAASGQGFSARGRCDLAGAGEAFCFG